jgi:streptomycin 6-kinase
MPDNVRFPIPDLVRRRAVSEGSMGMAWLASLDDTFAGLERDWNIQIGPAMDGGSAAFVAEAVTPRGEAFVVKVSTPATDTARHEANVLRSAAGKGYATLVRHDPARRAILLEKLGDRLDTLDMPYERRMNIACATLLDAWMLAPPDHGYTNGAQKAGTLAADIMDLWQAHGQPCPSSVVERALLYCRERATSYARGTIILAHGDPHPGNILAVPDSEPLRFKLIDPDGLAIEPAYDLGVLLRGWDEGLGSRHAHDIARSHARHLGTRTQVSAEAIWQWGFIERVSTGLHLLQLGETDQARGFLRIAEALNTF